MADQQDHLMEATGADVDDAPPPAAPPSTIVIFDAVHGGDLNDPAPNGLCVAVIPAVVYFGS